MLLISFLSAYTETPSLSFLQVSAMSESLQDASQGKLAILSISGITGVQLFQSLLGTAAP